MISRLTPLYVLSAISLLGGLPATAIEENPASLVNPFVGTRSIGDTGDAEATFSLLRAFKPGNTFPGAVAPWGMISVSPHTSLSKEDYIGSQSGYYTTSDYIYGFGMNHISGAGCPDLGNCLVTATTGQLLFDKNANRSRFADEVATPGYYSVRLTTAGIKVECASTERAGILRFRADKPGAPINVMVDASHLLSWCDERWGEVELVSADAFELQSEFGNLCQNFGRFNNRAVPCDTAARRKVYFVGRFLSPPVRSGLHIDENISPVSRASGGRVGAFFSFESDPAEVLLKIGISYTSIENARLNLETEIPDWDLERVARQTYETWNRALSALTIEGGSREDRITFYSALYHCLIHPNVFADVNGEHIGYESTEKHVASGYTRYSVFSLWDTYRSLHPLLTLAYPDKQANMNASIAAMYRERGRLPKWELNGRETGTMVGDPVVPVLVDSFLKGVRNFDVHTAYEAMKESALVPEKSVRQGLKHYMELGYVPHDKETGSVSKTIDFGYADWLLARLAAALGKTDDERFFEQRSLGYRQLIDPQDGFIKPRLADGAWLDPFNPLAPEGYVEGNAWHYSFTGFHDLDYYVAHTGGPGAFADRLNRAFSDEHHSWLIQPNQPDMNYPFLFALVGREAWRTQYYNSLLRGRSFGPGADGLYGNDDAGTFSAWYVFSAMGFYPLLLGTNDYVICNPAFESVSINLNDAYYPGKTFTVRARDLSKDNIYIQAITLNGRPHRSPLLRHEDIVAGGILELKMGSTPATGSSRSQ